MQGMPDILQDIFAVYTAGSVCIDQCGIQLHGCVQDVVSAQRYILTYKGTYMKQKVQNIHDLIRRVHAVA